MSAKDEKVAARRTLGRMDKVFGVAWILLVVGLVSTTVMSLAGSCDALVPGLLLIGVIFSPIMYGICTIEYQDNRGLRYTEFIDPEL